MDNATTKDRFIDFTLLISSIYRNIYRLKDKGMSELNLKGTHVTCLYYLHSYGACTAAFISKISGEDKAAISRSVEYLISEGYIGADGKNYRRPLELTAKGKQIAEYVYDEVNNVLLSVSAGITDKERQILYKSLGVIQKNLNDLTKSEE